jgi:hypothetical protein
MSKLKVSLLTSKKFSIMNLFFQNKQSIKHSTFMLCNVNDSAFADNDRILIQSNSFLHKKMRLPTSLQFQYFGAGTNTDVGISTAFA